MPSQQKTYHSERKPSRKKKTVHDIFAILLREAGIAEPVAEYRFCTRLWKFDYCWPDIGLAVECEGGIWGYGRHNRPEGMIRDMEKYNAAAQYGWYLLRYTPQQLTSMTTISQIKDTIERITSGEAFNLQYHLKFSPKKERPKIGKKKPMIVMKNKNKQKEEDGWD